MGITHKSKRGEEYEKRKATDTCNAFIGNREYCQNPAGWGTGHPGKDRCKLHGGFSTGRPQKTFKASKYLNNPLIKEFEKASERDPNFIYGLDSEIAIVKSALWNYKAYCMDNNLIPRPSALKNYEGALRKMLKTNRQLEKHRQDISALSAAYRKVALDILQRYVSPAIVAKIKQELVAIDRRRLLAEQRKNSFSNWYQKTRDMTDPKIAEIAKFEKWFEVWYKNQERHRYKGIENKHRK
ncbi:MAG: hypothetical protein HYZ67_07815 [Chlamydiae bacterium]|nr:hypothetical protein [Chlamydiota bacterium]